MWLSLALMLAFFAVGPTTWLLEALPANLVDYAVNVIPMGFWLADSEAGHGWQTAWTVFYWGWWLAWTPFVSMFIARISKGRTVREFILGVLFVPSLVVLVWMTVFGGTALHQELSTAGSVSAAVETDYSMGLVATIENLAVPELQTAMLVVVSFLLFTWLITSLDSATLVICHILHFDHLGRHEGVVGFHSGRRYLHTHADWRYGSLAGSIHYHWFTHGGVHAADICFGLEAGRVEAAQHVEQISELPAIRLYWVDRPHWSNFATLAMSSSTRVL